MSPDADLAAVRAELAEARREQAATAEILKTISCSAFDLDKALQTLIDTAVGLTRGSRGTIFIREDDELVARAFHSNVSTELRTYLSATKWRVDGDSHMARAAREGAIVHVPDLSRSPIESDREVQRRASFGAGLWTPLMLHGQSIGVFGVPRDEPIAFSEREIALIQTFADQAVIAIENARLFGEVQSKTRDLEDSLAQQTATADALKVISRSALGLHEVMQTLVDSAVRLCADDGVVYLRKGEVFLAEAAFDADEEKIRARNRTPRRPGRSSMTARVALSGEVEFIPDTLADAEFEVAPDLRLKGIRSLLGVPLLREGRVEGVFILGKREPGRFGERALELAKTFADQAVIVIENVRLFDEVKSRTRDLEESLSQQTATADVLKVISRSAFNLQAVFDTLVRTAVELNNAYSGAICVRDGEVFAYRAFGGPGASPDLHRYLEAHPAVPGRASIAGRCLLTGKIEQIPDVREDADYAIPLRSGGNDARAVLGVPLLGKTRVEGALVLTRREPGEYPARQIEILQTFADQAVIALENARLLDEVQAKTRDLEESLAQQTATADVLKVISRSAFDLQGVLDTLVASAVTLCGADNGIMYLREGDAFQVRAAYNDVEFGEIVRRLKSVPHRPGRGSVGARVLLTGEVQHVPDLQADFSYDASFRAASVGRALLGVPLKRDNEIVGAIVFIRRASGAYASRQVDIACTFADQAVIAIENARLFEQVRARTHELESSLADLRKAQDRLVQSEKLASLGQLTAGIAHEIKNPLNFVNNFSSLSRELLGELRGILAVQTLQPEARSEVDELFDLLDSNLDKVAHHGKRADSIVKNMLLHSREGSGERTHVNINAMVEEALNLGYHGARAEKPGFNVTIEKAFDPAAGGAEIYLQEMTRVLLNLISNGFYATAKRMSSERAAYEPTLKASTRDLGECVEIRIRDNGTGVSEAVRGKMFNPFFTTKPAGEGTGLGLSLSHDIVVKQHGGAIDVITEEGVFTEFVITLPRAESAPRPPA